MADDRKSHLARPAVSEPREVGDPLQPATSIGVQGRPSQGKSDPSNTGRTAATVAVQHGWFWWWCYAVAWLGVLALGVVALLRMTFHDGTLLLTCINAFTLYAYLPAYLVLACAFWYRRWWLAAASGLVVLCHVAWVAPDFAPAKASAAAVDGGPVVKIFYANIAIDNYDPFGFLREVENAEADVVVLVEYFRRWHEMVMDWPGLNDYQYGTGLTMPYAPEIAVFSKLPITRVERHRPAGNFVDLYDVHVGSQTLRMVALHGPRPMDPPGHDYFGFWKEVEPLLEKQSGPLLVIGDFNATQHSKVYKSLTRGPLRSAHRDRGRGWATTWPNGEFPAPPIRIDQALVSPEVQCLRISEGRGRGSDHRPLVLEVRMRN